MSRPPQRTDDGAPARPGAPGSRSPFASSRPDGAPATPIGWDARFAQLTGALEQFRIDIERYFNGALTIPPEELKGRLERELRELRASPVKTAADQFRLGSFEARLNSLAELYGRRLREREEGRAPKPVRIVAAERPLHDAAAGIVLSSRVDSSAVEALWQGLAAAGGGARLELETFRTYIAKQVTEIRGRTGSKAVQFRVVNEEGRLKLKAKPVDPGATS